MYRVTCHHNGAELELMRSHFAIVAARFLMRVTGIASIEVLRLRNPAPRAWAIGDALRRADFVRLDSVAGSREIAAQLQRGTGSHTIITSRREFRAERCPPYGHNRPDGRMRPVLPGYPRGSIDLTKLAKAPHDKTRALSEPGRLGHFKGAA